MLKSRVVCFAAKRDSVTPVMYGSALRWGKNYTTTK
jgi:hypothetical protein